MTEEHQFNATLHTKVTPSLSMTEEHQFNATLHTKVTPSLSMTEEHQFNATLHTKVTPSLSMTEEHQFNATLHKTTTGPKNQTNSCLSAEQQFEVYIIITTAINYDLIDTSLQDSELTTSTKWIIIIIVYNTLQHYLTIRSEDQPVKLYIPFILIFQKQKQIESV